MRKTRGSAMIEAAVCLAILTPVVFAAVRLGYGMNEVHNLQAAAAEGAKAGAACKSDEAIIDAARAQAPELRPADILIERMTDAPRPTIRVSIPNFPVARLSGAAPLAVAPSSEFPFPCQEQLLDLGN